MSRAPAAAGALILALGSYLTADIFDLVPGALTLGLSSSDVGMPAVPTSTPGSSPSVTFTPATIPSAVVSPAEPLPIAGDSAPMPTGAGLRAALNRALADSGLGSSVGLTIRDASTGTHLLDVSAQLPRTPASTVKLLTATAIVSTLDPGTTFSTRALRGTGPHDVILVTGGDTLLSPGKGNPSAVAGRAGLADLADQTARALRADGVTRIRLHIDERYAPGRWYAPGWLDADVNAGLTGPVAMLGPSTERPVPGGVAFSDPVSSTARAFRKQLAGHGLTVDPAIDHMAAPAGAPDLGVAAWVKKTVKARGVSVEGVTMIDTSGLSAGSLVTAYALGDVLELAAGGKDPALQDVVAQLPVAGLTGTLADRFLTGSSHPAAGIVRAKTGTLTGASALAGTVVDKDGRLLVFAILADRIPPGVGKLTARAALDRFVATLASCGCG